MNTTHPKKRRKPIKTIELNGQTHEFYAIEQADEILHSRYMVAEIQELYIRAGISEGFLKEIARLLIDRSMEAKDLKQLREDMIAIGQNLEGRLGMIAERKMYEQLACVYFMMDDEPAEYDEDWAARKIAVWRAAGEADFFILKAFNLTQQSANISMKDILAVWQAVQERVSQLPTLPD